MTTLDAVPKKKPEPSAEELAALELVWLAREQGLSLTGPDGLLKQFTKSVLETALNEEMTEYLGVAVLLAPRLPSTYIRARRCRAARAASPATSASATTASSTALGQVGSALVSRSALQAGARLSRKPSWHWW